MPSATANGIQIEYDTFGDNSSRPLLLIIGLGGQMIFWDEELCERLAESGHYVIRFDNRDAGLSTKFEGAGVPDVVQVMTARLRGEKVEAAYTLDDMADDAVGLLNALDISKSHVCGVSMGGAIAQTIAIRHPSRVLSMISIYASSGNPELPQPKPEAIQALTTPPPEERGAAIEYLIEVSRTVSGSGFPFEEERTRALRTRAYDRGFYPQGAARQLAAIAAHGNRKSALASVTAPTLVIHGSEDPLVPVEGGKDVAEAISGAELMIIDGMGHDLPHYAGAWPQIVDAIVKHTHRTGT